MTENEDYFVIPDNLGYSLEVFIYRLNKLSKFSKPLKHKKAKVTTNINNKSLIATTKTEGLASELREAAIINELRSFKLEKSENQFLYVRNQISNLYKDDNHKVAILRNYKNSWQKIWQGQPRSIQIYSGQSVALDNQSVYELFTNGSYSHTDKEKFLQFNNLDNGIFTSPALRFLLKSLILDVEHLMTSFKKDFIGQLMAYSITESRWQSLSPNAQKTYKRVESVANNGDKK